MYKKFIDLKTISIIVLTSESASIRWMGSQKKAM